ncbi:MAG: UDP-N-acetylmuramoyl-tripeptide--D-alanyl-D-alanine ligase [Rhodothermales bacterium]|nr:UDP-N-acetylmuramoyl-tripeptide--D-alanyl-D-alanine ligase [Rhodothermales bacterium]
MDALFQILYSLGIAAATLSALWRCWQRLRFYLHMLQLESYKPPRFRSWLRSRGRSQIVRISHILGLLLVATAAFHRYGAVAAALLWTIAFASSRHYLGFQIKKPIAFTGRMKRLAGAAFVCATAPVAGGALLAFSAGPLQGAAGYLLGWLAADLLAPLWVLLAAYLMAPYERWLQNGFKRQATETLRRRTDLQVIGVTGSYGKTSVKFIVAEILRQRGNVLATPGSYNTPMGICLVINEQLKPEHQLLVLEMGMRYRGDLRELCAIAAPDLGIVTSVGPAHLETMGSIEAIAAEKSDLLGGLKPGGVAVLNADDPNVEAMAARAPGKVWRVSAGAVPDADIVARDLVYGPEGLSFIVRDDTGAEHPFRSQLLGQHNVVNILLGVAVGRHYGMRLRQIAHAVARIEPIEHRLQLRRQGTYTIIDDAFNANPVGARHALDVLGAFTGGQRVVVTPGMVELGARQEEENRLFGEHMAGQVDLAILIGDEQTRPIQEGLRRRAFPEDHILIYPSFSDARAYLDCHLQAGDTVLFENDLPDTYNARS